MFEDERRDAVVDLRPHLRRRDGTKFVAWNLDRERHSAAAADVDDLRGLAQETRDGCERPDRRGETDPLGFRAAVLA